MKLKTMIGMTALVAVFGIGTLQAAELTITEMSITGGTFVATSQSFCFHLRSPSFAGPANPLVAGKSPND